MSTGDAESESTAVYLDYNSTTPLAPEVVDKMVDVMKGAWGNPSSGHAMGAKAREVIDESRKAVSRMIGGRADGQGVIFTSGGTEANNMAILSATTNRNLASGKPHVITSSVEHDSVIKCIQELEKQGLIEFSVAPVYPFEASTIVSSVQSLVRDTTCLVTFMHANNESGLIMPIRDITVALKDINADRSKNDLPHIWFHTDAAQSIGKIPVSVNELGADYLTIVGHKFYGPRIGALYVKDINSTPIVPVLQGGGQERGHRPGTENTVMIAGLGTAAELLAGVKVHEIYAHMLDMRNELKKLLKRHIPGLEVNFDLELTSVLPNTLSIAVPSPLNGAVVLERCKGEIYASLGAACHSNIVTPSSILIASGLTEAKARRTIRLSIGRETSFIDIQIAVQALVVACCCLPDEIFD